MKNHRSPLAALFAMALVFLCTSANARPSALQDAPQSMSGTERTAPWDAETLELFESLPLQDGGRIKPLRTYAAFTLLRFQGKRSIKTPDGQKLTPTEWLLDVLLFPEMAADYPLFLVQNDEVIGAMGLSIAGKKKRDRYSLTELRAGIPRLFSLAREYAAIEEKDRTTIQQQIYVLAMNLNAYSVLESHFDFGRTALEIPSNELVTEIFEGRSMATYDQVVAKTAELRQAYDGMMEDPNTASQADLQAIGGLLQETLALSDGTDYLAMIPPVKAEEEEWHSPASLFQMSFEEEALSPEHAQALASLVAVARNRAEPSALRDDLAELHGTLVGLAERRGEYEKIPLELTYYKAKLIDRSLMVFVLSFVLMSFMWLRPRNRVLYWLTSAAVVVPTALLVVAVVLRCLIRERPPVSTLYETVLFVTGVGAITALCIEAMNRQRVALSAAAILGMIGLFIANGYETLDKADTMPSLVAVLDTNFWLATHVTAITTGYSAGMLAALLGSVYILAKLFGFKRGDKAFYRGISRMVYGVLCFALIFSLVGTILGGIWANDSWGRFWGWDPKENGALLIVISQLVILHGRMGGYLRELGICMAAAFGGSVVAFSWWGVNLLGVGLHSYGFTSGIHQALWTYYLIQWGIVGLGGFVWLMDRARSTAAKAVPAERHEVDGDVSGTLA